MTDEQIKQMVDRFLSWKLPDDFVPDAGIKYEPLPDHFGKPIGTNLFTATQAEAMIRHITKELYYEPPTHN